MAAGEEYEAQQSEDKYGGLCTPASKLAGDPDSTALSASQRASVEMTEFGGNTSGRASVEMTGFGRNTSGRALVDMTGFGNQGGGELCGPHGGFFSRAT
jgi:hypothetical protein